MTWMAAAQPLFLAVVLAWSGRLKLVGGDIRHRAEKTALHRLLGDRWAVPAYLTVGGVEIALALALLATPGRPAPIAAAALAIGFLGYLGYAATAAPEASCGCMGAGRAPVSRRGVARAGLMLLAAVAAAVPGVAWWSAIRPASGALLVAEAAAMVALSPELDRHWLVPLRRLRVRLTHPLAGAPDAVPLHATVTRLQRSAAYRRVAPLLSSDVREHWDVDGWRIVCYAARHDDRPATAVFAVPLRPDEPAEVRVSIVDEEAALLPG
jgi:hypothetical protein